MAAEYVYGGNMHVAEEQGTGAGPPSAAAGTSSGSFETAGMIFVTGNLEWKF